MHGEGFLFFLVGGLGVESFVSTSSCTNAFRFVDYFFFDTPALEAKIQGDRGVLAGEAVG